MLRAERAKIGLYLNLWQIRSTKICHINLLGQEGNLAPVPLPTYLDITPAYAIGFLYLSKLEIVGKAVRSGH